jgi:hypothetical protein
VVWRREAPSDGVPAICSTVDWHIGLTHFNTSASVSWPVTLENVGAGYTIVELSQTHKTLSFHAFFDWDKVEALDNDWRSWSWQNVNIPTLRTRTPAIRLIARVEAKPLLQLAALSAFWHIDCSVLVLMAAVLGIVLEDTTSEFQIVFGFVRAVLNTLTIDRWLDIVSQRLASSPEMENDVSAQLLEVDEAIECLDYDDIRKMQEQKKNALKSNSSRNTYREEYRAEKKKAAPKPAPAPAPPKGRGRGRGKAKAAPIIPPAPMLLLDMHTFAHKDAKRFMPPNRAKLWKSNGEPPSWHTEVHPMPSCNRSIRKHGNGGALRMVISNAWYDWALLEGKSVDEIPMTGLATLLEIADD